MATQINERSRLPINLKLSDGAWAAVTPTNLRYRIDCQTTGRVILDWTDLTPASSVDIDVTPTQNQIIQDSNRYETKVMAVEANYDTDNQFVESFTWKVKNLQGFT